MEKLFIKNNLEYPYFTITTLKVKDYALSVIEQMNIGNVVTLNKEAIKRIK